jgi:hypothetical protein
MKRRGDLASFPCAFGADRRAGARAAAANILRGALVAIVLAAAPAAHAGNSVTDFAEPVPGLGGKTWLDLLRQAAPDLKVDGASDDRHLTGTLDKPLRPLSPAGEKRETPAPVDIASLDATRLDIGGKARWIVLGQGNSFEATPLMLFEASGEGRLLDAVDVVGDMHTSMEENAPIALGGGAALAVVRNWHDNSEESYDALTLALVAGDRFSLIGETGGVGARTAAARDAEGVSFDVRPERGRALASIVTTVTHEEQRFAADGQTPLGRPVVQKSQRIFRWNAAKGRYEEAGASR